MSKKIIAALLALTMTVGLAACGNGDSGTSEGSTSGDTSTSTSTESGDDAATEGGSAWIAADDLEDDAAPGENDDRAFAKFDEVVEVHYGYQIDPVDTTLPEGDSVDNNQYTRYLEENYNILQICYESGFNNLSNFNRQFKKITGTSPIEYRKKVLSDNKDLQQQQNTAAEFKDSVS